MSAANIMRLLLVVPPGLLAMIALAINTAAGQEAATAEPESEAVTAAEAGVAPAGSVDEFIVIGKRPDEQARADKMYAAMLRQQMYEEIERLRKAEELAWRESKLTFKTSEKSRITWGYDPAEDRKLRELTDINELPGDTVKPATLFRARF